MDSSALSPCLVVVLALLAPQDGMEQRVKDAQSRWNQWLGARIAKEANEAEIDRVIVEKKGAWLKAPDGTLLTVPVNDER